MHDLQNKVAVITGDNSGIGAATAKLLIDAGMKVVIFDRQISDATAKNDRCLSLQGDVTDLAALDQLYVQTMETFGKIDVLFANAGIGGSQPLHQVTEELFDKIISVNYKSVYFTVQRSLNYLNQNASLILMSSAHSYCATKNFSVYASSKAAIKHLAKCFAIELAERKIRVNSVSPAFVDTSIWNNLKKGLMDKNSGFFCAKPMR